jgi:DeoR family glycerol-3-phosphate regulon repressor
MSTGPASSAPTTPEPAGVDERRNEIVNLVRQKGFATVEMLAGHFEVTVQTIRRDLNDLSHQGRLARYRGGGGLPSSVANIDYSARQIMNQPEKEHIATLVARHVPDHVSVFINIGTTTEAVAGALIHHQDLRVITNNLNVATILSRRTDFEITITGGSVRNRDGGVLGQASVDMISQFRVDIGIIGISGIDADGTLLDFDYDEIRAAQTILRNARKTFLVTDHSKFMRRPLLRMASIGDVSAVFTDMPPPPAIADLLAASGTELHIAAPR